MEVLLCRSDSGKGGKFLAERWLHNLQTKRLWERQPLKLPQARFMRAKAVYDYLAPQIKASFHSITEQFPGPYQKKDLIFSDQIMLLF